MEYSLGDEKNPLILPNLWSILTSGTQDIQVENERRGAFTELMEVDASDNIPFPLEVQVDYFLNGFSERLRCFSKGLLSTNPGKCHVYIFYGLWLPGFP